jgi:N-acetylmuramic acid 6-phosphate (MurNAc-6-P) etherase
MKKLFENWRKHLEEAVPHSAHHVVKKMKKTGLSAKEALKSLTTDLSDEEAERWLERHKDEMESAKKDLDKGRK